MPTYQWKCAGCEVAIDILCRMDDRDRPPTEPCMCEAAQWNRVLEAPSVVGVASFLDGQRKFHEFREASKLERESRMSPNRDKKKEIAAEIRKLGVTTGRKDI